MAALLFATTACGSTLSKADQARLEANAVGGRGQAGVDGTVAGDGTAAAGVTDDGALDPSATGAATEPGAAGAGAAPSTGASRSATGRSTAPKAAGAKPSGASGGSAAGAASNGSDGASGPSAPGVTDTEIKVGLAYDQNAGATNAALGVAPAIGQIDFKRAYDALIAEVNRTGGVAGRKLKPVYFVTDSLAGKTTDTIMAEACSFFTQDNRVFGVLISGNDALRACMTKAGVVQVANGGGLSDSQTFKDYPYLVETGVPAIDRMARFKAEALKNAGYYGEGRDGPLPPTTPFKLGVILYDDPVFQRTLGVMKKELSAKGISVAKTIAIKRADSNDQLGDEIAAIRSAALQFKSENVTHVEFLALNNAFLQWQFMQSSENQLFRPRYGLSSIDGGQALATLLAGDAPSQLKSAVSTGWFPLFDVTASDYTGDKELPTLRRCKKILSDAGETFGDGDPTRNKEAQAASICDSFFYFQAALTLGGKQVTPQSWLAGVAKLDGLGSAATFVLKTTAERHDAPGAYKDVRWAGDCSCFHYTSDVHLV
jgi:hypothetical protein